jgi:MFS family permease
VPLYLSELAPARWRGALNMLFQLATTTGNLTANLINYGTGKINPWGWRLSLGLAGVPACLLILGSILAPETPNSLIERGHFEKGRATLEKVRGTPNVDLEYDDILEASRAANQVRILCVNHVRRCKNRLSCDCEFQSYVFFMQTLDPDHVVCLPSRFLYGQIY